MTGSKHKSVSIWSVLAGCSLGCSFFTFYKGIDRLINYYNSENFSFMNKNAYVGGDAYNYIINGTHATSFFVLTTMFVLAAIGLMILHYLSQLKSAPRTESADGGSGNSVLEDIEANLPKL